MCVLRGSVSGAARALPIAWAMTCACIVPTHAEYPLEPTTGVAPPAAWQSVQLVSVTGAPVSVPDAFTTPPTEALGRALEERLGGGESKSAQLTVERVRLISKPAGRQTHLGLGADFILRRGDQELRLPLEHSLNFLGIDD